MIYAHRLDDLLGGLDVSGLSTNPEIRNISLDSREVLPGGLFIALKGERIDARVFIPAMLESGACAALVDVDEQVSESSVSNVMQNVIQVKNLRGVLSQIAARFYNHPSDKLKVIGITGTNGKTTISWYLAQVFENVGIPTGMMGTLGAGSVKTANKAGIRLDATGLTTPDAVQVQKHLAQMLEAGLEVVCMEVSSHGLELGRVNEVKFDTVVFSNISQDHLDFHQTMAQYAASKMRLFEGGDFARAVINEDDDLGREIAKKLGVKSYTYGIDSGKLRAFDITLAPHGLEFTIAVSGESMSFNTSLIGQFNVYNMLAVLGTGLVLGYALETLAEALELCESVPGRMERIDEQPAQPVVVVDYAHTPDALEKALTACRGHCRGSLAVVFGCGGDRDKSKRPEMGRIAQRLADEVFITDDNPREEQPAAIITDIKRGMTEPAWVLHDRAQAIFAAISQAQAEDWVLIAGKGHETKQVYANKIVEFNDRVQARSALERMAA
jgi:UDP-N-acetylmuramoyl-L-alanyl-D-glutamate--2,6-diaminopimelate ligase